MTAYDDYADMRLYDSAMRDAFLEILQEARQKWLTKMQRARYKAAVTELRDLNREILLKLADRAQEEQSK